MTPDPEVQVHNPFALTVTLTSYSLTIASNGRSGSYLVHVFFRRGIKADNKRKFKLKISNA